MSINDPPEFVVNIYNPDFFTVATGTGISIAQADSLFLIKNTADTATALETFTGGIAADIQGDPTGTNTLFNNQTGNISIATNAVSQTVNIATGNSNNVNNVINIGNSNMTSFNLKTARVDVGGIIDRLDAGAINIATAESATSLELGTATSVTTIDIGNTNAATVTTIQNPVLQMNYSTAPSLTNVHIGYSFRSNVGNFPAAIGNGQTAQAYSPTVGSGLAAKLIEPITSII